MNSSKNEIKKPVLTILLFAIVILTLTTIGFYFSVRHQLEKLTTEFSDRVKPFGELTYKNLDLNPFSPNARLEDLTFKMRDSNAILKASSLTLDRISWIDILLIYKNEEFPPKMRVSIQELTAPLGDIFQGSKFIKAMELDDVKWHLVFSYDYQIEKSELEVNEIVLNATDLFDLKSDLTLSHFPKININSFSSLDTEKEKDKFKNEFLESHFKKATINLNNDRLTEKVKSAFKVAYGFDLMQTLSVSETILSFIKFDKAKKNVSTLSTFFKSPDHYYLDIKAREDVTLKKFTDPNLWLELTKHFNIDVEKNKQ